MGWTGAVIKWLIDRNQSRLNEMSKDSRETDFKLKYGDLEGLCTKKQFEGIKKIYQELEELKTNLGQAYEIIPAPFEKIERRNELEFFFNDIETSIAKGKLDTAIRAIELKTQQKIDEATKNMVNAREDFIQKCSGYLSLNNQHMQNITILNKAISKINYAYYQNLDPYKNSPDFSVIKKKLNETKDKMILCEKHMYDFRRKGYNFSQHSKTELYKLETELSVFGSERLGGLKTIDDEIAMIRKKTVENALIKREEKIEQDEFAKFVDEVYEETNLIADAKIPIRSPHVSNNEQMTR